MVIFCGIKKDDICFDIYLHKNHKHRIAEVKKYWSKVTVFTIGRFTRLYFKKNKFTKRKHVANENYHGILKAMVKRSSTLLRMITGWTNGIYNGINKGQS